MHNSGFNSSFTLNQGCMYGCPELSKRLVMMLQTGWILLALIAGAVSVQAQHEQRPNIIFIMADDLGYGDLGCYGQEKIKTPIIDQFATQGIRFTDHYSGHTVCRPSRLVLWTGMHSGHTAICANAPYV